MALNPKITSHFRSKSAPIELHPFLSQFDEHFHGLKSCKNGSTSRPLICCKVDGLVGLYKCIDKLFQLLCVQQGFLVEKDEISVESLLDGSMWLIDVCGSIRDVLRQAIEGVTQLRTVLRRRPNEHELAKEVGVFMNSRKMVKKAVTKYLKEAKNSCKRFDLSPSCEYQDSNSVLGTLEESQSISINVFNSLLSYIASSSTLHGPSKLSLISKLVHSKQMVAETGDYLQRNKFEVVDDDLHKLITSQKTAECVKILQIDELRCHLDDLESIALDLETSVEGLCRLLIRYRVALLNTLNN